MMIAPEDLQILAMVGVVCMVVIVTITGWIIWTDWREKQLRLQLQRKKALSRGRHPVRNVDRFDTWREALVWFYTNDRKTRVPDGDGCSAAFLSWLFEPLEGKKK